MENSEERLSPSEKRTLQHLVEGERHASELDWVALQRLKRLGLRRCGGQASPSPRTASASCSACNLELASLTTWSQSKAQTRASSTVGRRSRDGSEISRPRRFT
jgi:hypothetical protein